MTERRSIGLTALAVAVAGIAVVLLVGLGRSPGSAPPPVSGSPRPIAVTFARAYARVLQGQLGVGALPAADPRVRAIAADTPERIAGAVALGDTRLRYVSGSRVAQALVAMTAGGRAIPFDLGLTFAGGRWQVTYLVPPDVGTAFAARPRIGAPAPAIRRAATRFALHYADYREAATRTPPAAWPQLRSEITAGNDPLAQITAQHGPARLRSLSFAPQQGDIAAATAVVTDRAGRLRFSFVMRRVAGSWQAWEFAQGTTG